MTARFDVMGLGALNVDHLVQTSSADALLEAAGLEWGTETAVDAATVRGVLDAVGPAAVTAQPGGSALNTVHALARTGLGLRLAYVGVAGRTPVPGTSGHDLLRRLAVDTSRVGTTDEAMSGVCLSVPSRGERTLLTHDGANAWMARTIDTRFDDLVAHLARARIVHVTSFLDDDTPPRLARLLRAVKQRSPGTLLSLDPGHVWCAGRPEGVPELVALADLLELNRREFQDLGGAAALLRRNTPVVLVKQPDGVTTYGVEDGKIRERTYAHPPLREAEIVDATGAGDVFAAGLLAAVARGRPVGDGVRLGSALARHKLRHAGAGGHDGFAGLAGEALGDTSA